MSRRPVRSVVLASALASTLGVAALACSSPPEAATSIVDDIDAPRRVVAGEEVAVVVEADGTGPVSLDVIDAFATTTLTLDADRRDTDDRLAFEIPDHLTEASGVITFLAHGAVGDGVTTSMLVVPAGADDPLDVLVGPRTVVADGADETMAIGFVTDRFGNPLLDGTAVDITLIDDDAETIVLESTLTGGLAPRLIGSGTVAQRVELYASVDGDRIASRRVDYDEVPGPAAAIDFDLPDDLAEPNRRLVADGRSIFTVRTALLADRFGNQLIDGRLVRLETTGPDGVGQLTARTIDGVARFDIVAPSQPGPLSVRASVDGVVSAAQLLDYASAISALPIAVGSDTAALSVSIGPVRDARGAVVVDGTEARVDVIDATPQRNVVESREVQLIDGRAVVVFDPTTVEPAFFDIDGTVEVSVLGSVTDEERP